MFKNVKSSFINTDFLKSQQINIDKINNNDK